VLDIDRDRQRILARLSRSRRTRGSAWRTYNVGDELGCKVTKVVTSGVRRDHGTESRVLVQISELAA